MKVICDNCGKEFNKRRNYVEKRSNHNFCSRKCYGKYKSEHKLGVSTEKKEHTIIKKLEEISKKRRIL